MAKYAICTLKLFTIQKLIDQSMKQKIDDT